MKKLSLILIVSILMTVSLKTIAWADGPGAGHEGNKNGRTISVGSGSGRGGEGNRSSAMVADSLARGGSGRSAGGEGSKTCGARSK